MPSPCWCHGTNEHCAFCGGSGERLTVKEEAEQRGSKLRKVHGSTRSPALKKVRNSQLGKKLGLQATELTCVKYVIPPPHGAKPKHLKIAKDITYYDLSEPRQHSKGKRRSRCSGGPARTMSVEFRLHTKFAPSSAATSSPEPRPREPSRSLVICDECNVSVRSDRLARHKRRVHSDSSAAGVRRSTVPRSRSSASSVRIPVKPTTGQGEADTERSLEATVDYWWARREGGRFGSHPVHDNYDENGQP